MLVLDVLLIIKKYIYQQDKLEIRLPFPLVNKNKFLSFNINFLVFSR